MTVLLLLISTLIFSQVDARSRQTDGEIAAVLRAQDVLSEYGQRDSDCFRRASRLIRVQCSQLDMDENERVKAAISMTLCELATAKHHSFPLECAPFAEEAPEIDTEIQSHCVGALARSAQFWSSYSGYLREIPQLCFAFRRWSDIDFARDLYRNATLEKLQLIRTLTDRDKLAERHMQRWDDHLLELNNVANLMGSISNHIISTSGEVSVRLLADVDNMRRLLSAMVTEARKRDEENHTVALKNVVNSLSSISQAHGDAIQNTFLDFQQMLATHMQSIFSLSLKQNQAVLDKAIEAGRRVGLLDKDLQSLHESATSLTHAVGQTIVALSESQARMQDLHQYQEEAATSAADALRAITQLTVLTETEFRNINQSALMLKQTLTPSSEQFTGLWNSFWPSVISPVFKVGPDSILLIRAVSVVVGLLFTIVRTGFSMIMAALFVVLSTRHSSRSRPENRLDSGRLSTDPRVAHLDLPLVSRGSRLNNRLSRIPDRLWRPQAYGV